MVLKKKLQELKVYEENSIATIEQLQELFKEFDAEEEKALLKQLLAHKRKSLVCLDSLIAICSDYV